MRETGALEIRRLAATDPEVGAAWRRLQAAGGVGSPFLAWQWISALADVPEASGGIDVLAADGGGRPVGLLPVQRRDRPGRLRTLGLAPEWLGADHLDVVAEPRDRPLVAEAIAGHLAGWPAWQLLDLDGLDRAGALAAQVRRRLRPPRFVPVPPVGIPAPYVTLEAPGRFLRSNAMKEAARKARGVERAGGGFSVVQAPDRVAELLEELMDLHNRRMGSNSAVFATPPRRRFHLLAARRMAEAGMARIYRLVADGVNAALQYDLVLGDRVYFYQSGMVPGAGRSPGLTVLGQAIRSAAEEGFREFDLLRGDEPYKHRFATGTRHDLRLLVLRLTPGAALHGGRWLTAKAGRRAAGWLGARMGGGRRWR
jgi:CelD/BcsL family acetyltransferase involved in cellulose biosynthesis